MIQAVHCCFGSPTEARHSLYQTMSSPALLSTDQIRTLFSRAMSQMYREEVPHYGALLDLVADINALTLMEDTHLKAQLARNDELGRLELERHGAIRLGTAAELDMMRRIFRVMGMEPVGYYDLSVAGMPVHSTAFRPIDDAALVLNPFRVFTSLLRLELIPDVALRDEVAAILSRRQIFSQRAISLAERFEQVGGLTADEAGEFVTQVMETFRWDCESTVDEATYLRLHDAHRLIADVACFKGPHINHLTPRVLDIDAAQAEMPRRGLSAKDAIEGPPRRACPVLLRQTSFKALKERVSFAGAGSSASGTHTARFGEVEQRGMALTQKGRALYDRLLASVHAQETAGHAGRSYTERLAEAFAEFPDDEGRIRAQGLAFFRYTLTPQGRSAAAGPALDTGNGTVDMDMDSLIARGWVQTQPITYEDFLPVSAAGIFQSNLGDREQRNYMPNEAKAAFELALGCPVHDEIALYERSQDDSIARVLEHLLKRPHDLTHTPSHGPVHGAEIGGRHAG